MFTLGLVLLEGISPASRPRWSGDGGGLFSPERGCFSLDGKARFWFNSKSSTGQGTLPEKLPVLLSLGLAAFLFSGNVMSALTSLDLCSQFNWGRKRKKKWF